MERRVIKNSITKNTRTEYKVGGAVWIYFKLTKPGLTKKLAHLWNGPFRVQEKINEFTYKVQVGGIDARFFPLVHISQMKPYIAPAARPNTVLENHTELVDFDESLLPEDMWKPIMQGVNMRLSEFWMTKCYVLQDLEQDI